MNVRGVKDSEVFLRILNNRLISDNPLFCELSNAKDAKAQQQDSFSITNLVLQKISALQRKILMVIDNAEDLITFDKRNFRILVRFLLTQVPQLHILITARCRFKSSNDLTGEIILLYGLNNI